MTSASGLGYVLIALGPAFSLFILVISHKSFLVLTVLTRKVEVALNFLAVKCSKPRLSVNDKLELALATGFGHGLAHSVFFCLSVLTPAFGPATFYIDTCRQLPYFLIVALTSLGFLIIHTSGMVIAFNGYMDGNKGTQLFVPVIHLVASFLTMVNIIPGGCTLGVSMILVIAGLGAGVCGRIVWDKTGEDIIAVSTQHRMHIG
ncbi:hypothetical protein O6H91_Y057400 [Diphasiastrum complanatum]|nr:hypothetical protein O6H91_Y057400 [Diphasiastrum complanatum]